MPSQSICEGHRASYKEGTCTILDRTVANILFSQLFEDYSMDNLVTATSDPYAIMITLSKESRRRASMPVSHSFRYEAMWRRAPDYKDVLESA
jgi:hypothetical protein